MRFSRIPIYLLTILIIMSLALSAMAGEIHTAAANGDLDQVKSLLAGDATLVSAEDQNATGGDSDGSTPLHVAAMRGHLACVEYLVEKGADVAYQDRNGSWSLSFAVAGGNEDIPARLIEYGAPLNLRTETGLTLLHFVAFRGQAESMAGLIASGIDVNMVDNWERSALWVTAGHGNADMVRSLIEAGANPDRANVYGATPILRAARQGHAEIVSILIESGAGLENREARCGRTALHYAAMSGYGDCVEALIEGGASVSARDHLGNNPMDLAQRYGHDTSVKFLTAKGAVPGEAPSPCPAESGCLAVCKNDAAAEGKILAEGEARLWYMGHSGYAIQTRNNLLVFDYFPGGRCMNVTVFVSHEHGDHFAPEIFEWAGTVPNIRYVMGCQAETEVPYDLVNPRQTADFDGVQVRTIESNDSGVGFLVEVDGITIYHAGDHANRLQDFSGPYCAEIFRRPGSRAAGRELRP